MSPETLQGQDYQEHMKTNQEIAEQISRIATKLGEKALNAGIRQSVGQGELISSTGSYISVKDERSVDTQYTVNADDESKLKLDKSKDVYPSGYKGTTHEGVFLSTDGKKVEGSYSSSLIDDEGIVRGYSKDLTDKEIITGAASILGKTRSGINRIKSNKVESFLKQ